MRGILSLSYMNGGIAMKKYINIKDKETAIKELAKYKDKKYLSVVRFVNVNLKQINEVVGFTLFHKNDLFVEAETLYDLMHQKGNRGVKHNYHGLSAEQIIKSLNRIKMLFCILKEDIDRYAISLIAESDSSLPMLIVIQINASLENDLNAKINKLVTIFPKDRIKTFIKGFSTSNILYLNRIELDKIK